MTKEELKKEAREDVDSLNGVDLVSSTIVGIDRYGAYKIGRYDGYLAGAEPREKRIAELEKKLTEKVTLESLDVVSGKIAELERKLEQTEKELADYQFNYPTIKELEKENAELKEHIKADCIDCTDYYKNKRLEKENAELKAFKEKCKFNVSDICKEIETENNLTKAKELLKRCYDNYIYLQPLRGDIEQFIKDSEVEK